MLDDSGRQCGAQAIAVDNRDAFLKRRRVRNGGTGADRGRRIADHSEIASVQKNASRALPQTPAGHRREMLADSVDLFDLCPAVHEHPVRSLQVGEGQSGRGLDQQRGRAAGQHEEDRVVLGRGFDGLHDLSRACETRRVWHGMPALEYSDTPQRLTMTMFDEHGAGIDAIAEHRFEPARERGGRRASAGNKILPRPGCGSGTSTDPPGPK